MKKFKSTIIVLVLILTMFIPTTNSNAEVLTDYSKSVFDIQNNFISSSDNTIYNANHMVMNGTCFYIGDNLFVTAAHCVEKRTDQIGSSTIRINYYDKNKKGVLVKKMIKVIKVMYDNTNDVAVVKVKSVPKSFVALDIKYNSNWCNDSNIYSYGFLGIKDRVMVNYTGTIMYNESVNIMYYNGTRMVNDALISNMHSDQGLSGAPVFNKDGDVTGLIFGYNKDYTFIAKIDYINSLLVSLDNDEETMN